MKIAIIEDNIKAQELLSGLVTRYFPELHIAGLATNLDDGLTLIRQARPDLLLLDIQLRDGTVFELLRRLEPDYLDRAGLIFITAFSTMDNMYQALRMSAIDFLNKPVDEQRFQEALRDAIGRVGRPPLRERLDYLGHLSQGGPLTKLPVHLAKGLIEFVSREQILYLKGEENITYFHLLDGRRLSAMRHLGFYQQSLDATGRFFRIAKPLIINLDHLLRYDTSGQVAHLSGDTRLQASRRGGRALADFLKGNGL